MQYHHYSAHTDKMGICPTAGTPRPPAARATALAMRHAHSVLLSSPPGSQLDAQKGHGSCHVCNLPVRPPPPPPGSSSYHTGVSSISKMINHMAAPVKKLQGTHPHQLSDSSQSQRLPHAASNIKQQSNSKTGTVRLHPRQLAASAIRLPAGMQGGQ